VTSRKFEERFSHETLLKSRSEAKNRTGFPTENGRRGGAGDPYFGAPNSSSKPGALNGSSTLGGVKTG
jgi:hypothetical protein